MRMDNQLSLVLWRNQVLVRTLQLVEKQTTNENSMHLYYH